jgi:hypothetical protein
VSALVDEVCRRAMGRENAAVPHDLDLVAWTRQKVTPMVEGLFPAVERERNYDRQIAHGTALTGGLAVPGPLATHSRSHTILHGITASSSNE